MIKNEPIFSCFSNKFSLTRIKYLGNFAYVFSLATTLCASEVSPDNISSKYVLVVHICLQEKHISFWPSWQRQEHLSIPEAEVRPSHLMVSDTEESEVTSGAIYGNKNPPDCFGVSLHSPKAGKFSYPLHWRHMRTTAYYSQPVRLFAEQLF